MKLKISIAIAIILGVIMIISGLLLQMTQYQKDIAGYQKEIKDLNARLDIIASDNTRLIEENEALWHNYYMNVTNQEGYEYYE